MSARIYPTLRYDDAPGAIEWLHTVVGFETHARYDAPDGGVAHAELRLGDAMVMLGSWKDDWARSKRPREAGGVTQAAYIAVDDADALYARATAAGADVVRAIEDTDHGSRDFALRDPEGHLWHFGTYDPLR